MKNGRAMLWAAGTTAVSAVLLTAQHGIPTLGQVTWGGSTMFLIAWAVFRFSPDRIPGD